MKSALPATVDTITNGYVQEVAVVVHAEWNYNRYYRTLTDNTPSEDTDGYDIELFPIESITRSNRPTSGINKAVVGQSTVESGKHTIVPAARYYLSSDADLYKYWHSPVASDDIAPYAITDCAPQVTYVEEDTDDGIAVYSNKIFFTVENTWTHPTVYDVQAKQDVGDGWATIASNLAIPENGKVELWFNGTDWTTTKNLDHATTVNAVRLVVNNLSSYGYFSLIELGAGLELDLSDDAITTDDGFSMGEVDFITPLGNISSNQGHVVLMNEDEQYSNNNPDSILFGLLDKGVKFNVWFSYGVDDVQEFELYSDTWEEEDGQTTVNLIDNTTYLMETKPPVVLYQNIAVQEAVWRVCDIIGFTNYEVDMLDESPAAMIDIFWTDGTKTAWEIFGDLSRATQTAIYFDAYGKLQIKTRDAAWNNTKPNDYEFNREDVGTTPANIVTLTDSSDYEANKVTVNWKPTGFSELVDNIVPFEVVWEPESDVVLRSSELAKSMTATDTIITMGKADGSTWPATGMMNIEGEWITYDGKEYNYYDESSVRHTVWISDYDEQKRLDDRTPAPYLHLNAYTGRLKVKERGAYNTEAKAHLIDLANWTQARQFNYGTSYTPCTGIHLNTGSSTVTISSPDKCDMKDYSYLRHGLTTDKGYWFLGTRLKIDKTAHRDKVGGIFFNADYGLGTGYYLEVTATAKFTGTRRATGNEIMFYAMKADGTKKVFGGEKITLKDKSKDHGGTIKRDIGREHAVPMGVYLDLDIDFSVAGNGDHVIGIYCNGSLMFTATVPNNSGWQHAQVGNFGLYARGHSSVTFEYIYGIASEGVEPPDSESYFDRIQNGYYATQANDWTFNTRTASRLVKRRWTKYQQRYNQRFFDDFGAWCHELRQFDVTYTSDLPSLQAKLYSSNTTQTVPIEFWTTPKAAHFIIVNVSRQNAVLSGDDELTAQGNGTITQKLFVYGRPVIQKDAQSVEKDDTWAQRRRGVIDIEYDSDWIQSQAEADRFSDWLTSHWTRSDSKLEVEVAANPLIELGDVVGVKWKDIDDDFYVTSVSNTFEQGITTTLSLRKVTR